MPNDFADKPVAEADAAAGMPIAGERLRRQINFLLEVDSLKRVVRRTLLVDGSRLENSAEHSWHLAVAALILAEHAEDPALEALHAIRLLLVHDLIEIDAGDTYCYDRDGRRDQKRRESAAAERIFSLLPSDQQRAFRSLWDEFEARTSAEARFAHALDRLMPLLHNFATEGKVWKENRIRRAQVEERMAPIKAGSAALHRFVGALIDEAVRRGYLAE